jgi:SOS response regulatory protein OraA/RecX
MDHFDKQFLSSFLDNNDRQKHVQEEIMKNFSTNLSDENEIEAVRQAVKEFREELLQKRKEKLLLKKGGDNSPILKPS